MKKIIICLLLASNTYLGGIYTFIPAIRQVKADILIEKSKLSFSDKSLLECRKEGHEMAYARQNDFKTFAMKTDAKIKQQIFQQGLLAGALSVTKNIPAPKDYEDFERFQKEFDESK